MRYSGMANPIMRNHPYKLIAGSVSQLSAGLLSLFCLCCTTGTGNLLPARASNIDITVISAGSAGHPLGGVTVTGIRNDGKYVHVGETDIVGHIHVSKNQLSAGVTALIFCHRTYFCGAIIIADKQLLEYDEYLIALAPVAVR